jgi:hypothetical protein
MLTVPRAAIIEHREVMAVLVTSGLFLLCLLPFAWVVT